MTELMNVPPIDYLVVGHVTRDRQPQGWAPGGTAAYAALTARAFGLRVGVVTAAGDDWPLETLDGVHVLRLDSPHSTEFENRETPAGRQQVLHRRARPLTWKQIPARWRRASIVHLGPVADELPFTPPQLQTGLLGLTPQGWLRTWDEQGRVHPAPRRDDLAALFSAAGAVVLSLEDLAGDEQLLDDLVLQTRVLALTEGAEGVRLYWNGDLRRFRPPQVTPRDTTGAGDVFAAAFFIRLYQTRDPWEAARFAVRLAAHSVTRPGLQAAPTVAEIQQSLVEVL